MRNDPGLGYDEAEEGRGSQVLVLIIQYSLSRVPGVLIIQGARRSLNKVTKSSTNSVPTQYHYSGHQRRCGLTT